MSRWIYASDATVKIGIHHKQMKRGHQRGVLELKKTGGLLPF